MADFSAKFITEYEPMFAQNNFVSNYLCFRVYISRF